MILMILSNNILSFFIEIKLEGRKLMEILLISLLSNISIYDIMIKMIVSIYDSVTEDIFNGVDNKKTQKRLPTHLHKIAKRKLDMLHAAATLDDLKIPPSNNLEKLKGDRSQQYSIRINDQYRIVFSWIKNNAENVEILDYH